MEHKKYKSISKTYDIKTINYYKRNGFIGEGIEWYNSEKIHGANFSFICSPDGTMLHANRDAILENWEDKGETFNFHNFLNLEATARMEAGIRAMSAFLGRPIQVYCEMFGFGITGLQKVLTEEERAAKESSDPYIQYKQVPEPKEDESIEDAARSVRDYVILSIRIIGEYSYVAEPETSEWNCDKYLNLDEMIILCNRFNLPMAPILMRGSFEECLAFDSNYKSPYAAANGLNEDAEGFVMKPVIPTFDKYTEGKITMLKCVAEKFSDVKLSPQLADKKKKEIVVANNYLEHQTIIDGRANSVRVTNRAAGLGIASKSGMSNMGKLVLAVTADIIEEVEKELSIKLKDDQVKKAVVPLVKAFLS